MWSYVSQPRLSYYLHSKTCSLYLCWCKQRLEGGRGVAIILFCWHGQDMGHPKPCFSFQLIIKWEKTEMIQQLANWSKLEALHQPTSQPPHFFDLNKGLMHSPTLIPRGPIDFLKTIAPPTLPTLTSRQLSLLYVYIYIAPSAPLYSIHRLHTHKRRRGRKKTWPIFSISPFFSLLLQSFSSHPLGCWPPTYPFLPI